MTGESNGVGETGVRDLFLMHDSRSPFLYSYSLLADHSSQTRQTRKDVKRANPKEPERPDKPDTPDQPIGSLVSDGQQRKTGTILPKWDGKAVERIVEHVGRVLCMTAREGPMERRETVTPFFSLALRLRSWIRKYLSGNSLAS